MIRFAICDDEAIHREIISDAIEDALAYSNERYEIYQYDNTEDLLVNADKYDILFLDVRFEHGLDGITAGKKLRLMGYSPILILISSHLDYCLDGYETRAISYLTKPIQPKRFMQVFSAAMKELENAKKRLIIQYGHSRQFILIERIMAVETYLGQRKIHTLDGIFQTNESMDAIIGRLPVYGFYRVSRAFLVNMHLIQRTDKEYIYMPCALQIKISRALANEFHVALNEFIGRTQHGYMDAEIIGI